jgi:hypothetical protein
MGDEHQVARVDLRGLKAEEKMDGLWIVTITRLDGKQRPPYKQLMGRVPNYGDVFMSTADGEAVKATVKHFYHERPAPQHSLGTSIGTYQVTAAEII